MLDKNIIIEYLNGNKKIVEIDYYYSRKVLHA